VTLADVTLLGARRSQFFPAAAPRACLLGRHKNGAAPESLGEVDRRGTLGREVTLSTLDRFARPSYSTIVSAATTERPVFRQSLLGGIGDGAIGTDQGREFASMSEHRAHVAVAPPRSLEMFRTGRQPQRLEPRCPGFTVLGHRLDHRKTPVETTEPARPAT
jgi:hypothetical protein